MQKGILMSGFVFVKPAKFFKHDLYFGAFWHFSFSSTEYDAGSELSNGNIASERSYVNEESSAALTHGQQTPPQRNILVGQI